MFQKADVRSNLMAPLSVFIGRKREIAGVKRLLHEHRLLTLTGPGGCGKTRLALRVAGGLTGSFRDGIWLVELGPLSDPTFIPQAVATTLGVREYSGAELTTILHNTLAPRETLLLLDNCEHLITATAQFAEDLLKSCPGVRILATSREGLGVTGEVLWPVPPLSLPPLKPWKTPAGAQETIRAYQSSESVQLFLARVESVLPGFAMTPENAAWIAEICRRLDGMPLAIELAAARARVLSVRQIAKRLDDRFNLLTSGSRTAPQRQQTLAATLDWSYTLLEQGERRVLQRLSVFAGGATLEAAEAVCHCECVQPGEVMDILSRLVDKSLIVVDQNPTETRYRLLETIRQYAREKLLEQGDEADCRDRHLEYFIHWAEKTAPIITGQDQLIGLAQFEGEHDNLRAALEWSNANEDRAESGLRLATACGSFWRIHCYIGEGRRRFAVALSSKRVQDRNLLRANALIEAANLAYLQADYPAEQALIDEALVIWRELGQEGRSGLAYTLELYGEMKTGEGDNQSALPLFQEALDIFRQVNDKNGIGLIYMQLGWVAIRTGEYLQAEAYLKKFLALAQASENRTSLNYAISGLGEVAVRQGHYEHASDLLERALVISRERGDKWAMGTVLGSLGWVALCRREFEQMRASLGESLAIRLEIGDQGGIAWCLEKLAQAAIIEGAPEKALRLFSAAAALRRLTGSVVDPVDLPEYTRCIHELQSRLGSEIFAACQAEGEAMPLREVIDLALFEPAAPLFGPRKGQSGGLSRRERQTAILIAQGKTNREIARAMTLTEKTVETYVTRILNKLGFSSRVQVATWVVETGLLPAPNHQ